MPRFSLSTHAHNIERASSSQMSWNVHKWFSDMDFYDIESYYPATMVSDYKLSAPTSPLQCASFLQPATRPYIVACESWTICVSLGPSLLQLVLNVTYY